VKTIDTTKNKIDKDLHKYSIQNIIYKIVKYAFICYVEWKSFSYRLRLELFLYAFSWSLRMAISQNTPHLLKLVNNF